MTYLAQHIDSIFLAMRLSYILFSLVALYFLVKSGKHLDIAAKEIEKAIKAIEYEEAAHQALSDVTFPGIDRTPAEHERLMRLGRERLAEIQKEKLADHQV